MHYIAQFGLHLLYDAIEAVIIIGVLRVGGYRIVRFR